MQNNLLKLLLYYNVILLKIVIFILWISYLSWMDLEPIENHDIFKNY